MIRGAGTHCFVLGRSFQQAAEYILQRNDQVVEKAALELRDHLGLLLLGHDLQPVGVEGIDLLQLQLAVPDA